MAEQAACGAVVGVTDEGYPIVTEDYGCPHWVGAAGPVPQNGIRFFTRAHGQRLLAAGPGLLKGVVPVSYTHLTLPTT